jgi:hypothetical protein
MGLLRKKSDPISVRAKALNAQIASLEAEIKRLDSKLRQNGTSSSSGVETSKKGAVLSREPVFEPVDHRHLEPSPDQEHTPEHYNDLGVRKYDLAAAWRRLRGQFQAPPASNPKLLTYLAAGSIKGLRPLRYEKRIARNRFIALFLILVCLIWGIIAVFVRTR